MTVADVALATRQRTQFDDIPPLTGWTNWNATRDWHEVPKGYYALPVCDWTIFQDMVGPHGPEDGGADGSCTCGRPEPIAPLLGYLLITRKTARHCANGRVIGRDALITGHQVVAEEAFPYGGKSPAERLHREIAEAWHDADHGDDWCQLPPVEQLYGQWFRKPGHCRYWYDLDWPRPTGEGAERWRRAVATVLLWDIEEGDDRFRGRYGQLTGRCGICGHLLTDPESKAAGIGPDCLRKLKRVVAALTTT